MKLNKAVKFLSASGRTLLALILLSFVGFGQDDDDDENYISPLRPSVSESAVIQKKGVLQIEYGGDFDFRSPEFRNAQSAPLGVYYAATDRLRFDFDFEAVSSEKDLMFQRKTGVGDVNLGFKTVIRDKPEKKIAVAFAYSIKLPAASADKDLGTGKIDHNLRFILDRSFGKNNYGINISYLNVGREMSDRRDSGAQVIARYERKLSDKIGLVDEVFGNTVDEKLPRGVYCQSALTYRLNKRMQLDIGVRPGFGRDAPNFGILGGIVVGIGKN